MVFREPGKCMEVMAVQPRKAESSMRSRPSLRETLVRPVQLVKACLPRWRMEAGKETLVRPVQPWKHMRPMVAMPLPRLTSFKPVHW